MAKTIKKAEQVEQSEEEKDNSDDIMSDIEIEDLPDTKVKGKSLKDAMKAANKKYGDNTMLSLGDIPDFPRLPSGVHAVDYTVGGGFPISQSSCLLGGSSGGKTTLALNSLAVFQVFCMRCYRPEKYCLCSTASLKQQAVIANIEGTLDSVWAKTLGVDVDSVYPLQAEHAEAYLDLLMSVLEADDCGLVIVDSVGALVPKAERDKPAESSNMGVSAKLITKMARLLKNQLINEAKRGHQALILYVNQRRMKLNVMYGSPESSPGGEAFLHEQSITLRNGKVGFTDAEKKVYKAAKDTDRDPATKHSVIVQKSKVFTIGSSCQYVRSIDYKHPAMGNASGKVMDFQFLIKQAKENGLLGDDPKKLIFMDTEYKTQIELMQQLNKDFQDKLWLSMLLVEKAKQDRRNA